MRRNQTRIEGTHLRNECLKNPSPDMIETIPAPGNQIKTIKSDSNLKSEPIGNRDRGELWEN